MLQSYTVNYNNKVIDSILKILNIKEDLVIIYKKLKTIEILNK